MTIGIAYKATAQYRVDRQGTIARGAYAVLYRCQKDLHGLNEMQTYFLCAALRCAAFSFFSATRLASMALQIWNGKYLQRLQMSGIHVLVLCLLLLLALDPAALERPKVAAALEAQGSNQSLDFRPMTK